MQASTNSLLSQPVNLFCQSLFTPADKRGGVGAVEGGECEDADAPQPQQPAEAVGRDSGAGAQWDGPPAQGPPTPACPHASLPSGTNLSVLLSKPTLLYCCKQSTGTMHASMLHIGIHARMTKVFL